MTKKIRVTRVVQFTYSPDYEDEFYKNLGIKSVEEALEVDRTEVESGEIDLSEIVETEKQISEVWEIIDE